MLFDQLLQLYRSFLDGTEERRERGGYEAQNVCPTFYAGMQIVWTVIVEHRTNRFTGVNCPTLTSYSP